MISLCRQVRKHILSVSKKSGHGHIPSCFSIVEILYAIYGVMRHDPKNPNLPDRDIFVLSKGHGALGYYCVLAAFGYFSPDKVESFGHFESDFGCHPDHLKVPGVETSTGSLGHGIGLAVGMALAFKIQQCSRRVFTVIGDGEANEGTVWESLLVAANLKLDNLTIVYDNNRSHLRGLQIEDPEAHFRGFGAEVKSVDGHEVSAIRGAISATTPQKVKVVVANTHKGYGCKTFINNSYEWHRKSPTEAEYEILMKELDEEAV